jgi:hypothetical protein
METYDIICSTCGSKSGTLTKDVITEADKDLYRRMVTCENGHSEYPIEETQEEVQE